jgi:hypothetical protein
MAICACATPPALHISRAADAVASKFLLSIFVMVIRFSSGFL